MKRLFVYIVSILGLIMFSGCQAAQVSASKAPTEMKLSENLMTNGEAVYYNKLINQYITDPAMIPSKPEVVDPQKQAEADKKMKEMFFKEFEKVGLSRQQALQAFKKWKNGNHEKRIMTDLPSGAKNGVILVQQGTAKMIRGKAVTNKDTKSVSLFFEGDNEAIIKKYAELELLFKKLLPSSQGWKQADEKATAAIYHKNVENMQAFYDKYNGDYIMLKDPKGYKEKIESWKEQEKTTLENPFSTFTYGWESEQRIGGAVLGSNFPNIVQISVRPLKNKKEASGFDSLSVTMIKVLY